MRRLVAVAELQYGDSVARLANGLRRGWCGVESRGHLEVAVEVDDERLEVVERLNEGECRTTGDGDRRGERVGQAQVNPRHRRRRRSRSGPARVWVDQVTTSFVRARRGYGSRTLHDAREVLRLLRIHDRSEERRCRGRV